MEVVCENALCGRTFDYRYGPAHFERSPHHFCCRSCQNTIHGLAGTPRHKIWEQVKKRAKHEGIPFSLTLDDIPEVPENCPVLGIKLQPNDKAGPLDSSPSLDRIVPNLGYIRGNVRIISFRANRLRSDASAKELRLIADDAERVERNNG